MQLGLLGSDGDAKGWQCCELSLPFPVGLYLLRISVGRWYSWSPGKEPATLSPYHLLTVILGDQGLMSRALLVLP